MSLASLEYHEKNPPFGVLACAELGGLGSGIEKVPRSDINVKQPPKMVVKAENVRFEGVATCLRFFARSGSAKSKLFMDASPVEATQIDQWIDWSVIMKPGQGFPALLKTLDAYLSTRAFLVGKELTLADIAVWGTLASTLLWANKLKKDKSLGNLVKWYEACSAIPEFDAVLTANNSKEKKKVADGKKEISVGSFDVKLEGAAKGKVVTRFPPEPSGYLHIGHAKASLLNQYFAKMYEGTLLLRFDDTNPSKEKDEFVENILNDLKTLEIVPDRTTYTSDYFPQIMKLAEKLIKKGHMYADDTSVEKMREERMDGIESVRRNRSVEETLAIFKEMQNGTEEGLKNCLRIKLDMQNPNKALRDPVCFRCNLTPHHRTGSTYKVTYTSLSLSLSLSCGCFCFDLT